MNERKASVSYPGRPGINNAINSPSRARNDAKESGEGIVTPQNRVKARTCSAKKSQARMDERDAIREKAERPEPAREITAGSRDESGKGRVKHRS